MLSVGGGVKIQEVIEDGLVLVKAWYEGCEGWIRCGSSELVKRY